MKRFEGKLFGAAIGFSFGGPIGAIVGAVVGHFIDTSLNKRGGVRGGNQRELAFITSLILLLVGTAKADGKISQEEATYLSSIFDTLAEKRDDRVQAKKIYKEIYKKKSFSDEEWIKIISENPKLLNRPIVLKGKKAVWGDPAKNIDTLF